MEAGRAPTPPLANPPRKTLQGGHRHPLRKQETHLQHGSSVALCSQHPKQSIRDSVGPLNDYHLLLRTGFGTKWPRSIEASSFRVIDSRADSNIVTGLRISYHSTLQADGLMHFGPTSDIGARGKRH
jgi:hypothetical protein